MILRGCLCLVLCAQALPGAEFEIHGWGHGVTGGLNAPLLMVTRLDDDVKKPVPGMLRWALQQKGPRVIHFNVEGELWLKDRIQVRNGHLTLDGFDAPGEGVCIRGGALEFIGCDEVVLRHFRVRLGDEQVLRRLKRDKLKRPRNSSGLDCVSLHECKGVVLDHLSLAWSCDELLSVVRCQRVTVQWCLLSEPLGLPKLHPYGDNHAYALNASASTLTVHHCVFAHYWMRGPQFEANDMRRGDGWEVQMEAVANVMADFGRSGIRYTTGPEDHKEEVRGRRFEFQFAGNAFVDSGGKKRCIEAVTRHGVHEGVRVWLSDNWLLQPGVGFVQKVSVTLEDGSALASATKGEQQQVSRTRLFKSPNPPVKDLGGAGLTRLFEEAGAGPVRDREDQRVVADILQGKVRPVLHSQRELRPPLLNAK